VNCFGQQDDGELESRSIRARDGEHPDNRTLAESVANLDPQTGDCSGISIALPTHGARSTFLPVTPKPASALRVPISARNRADTNGTASSRQGTRPWMIQAYTPFRSTPLQNR
jgi:hypothetical protein